MVYWPWTFFLQVFLKYLISMWHNYEDHLSLWIKEMLKVTVCGMWHHVFLWVTVWHCQQLDCLASNGTMTDKQWVGKIWKEAVMASWKYSLGIYMEGVTKSCKTSFRVASVPAGIQTKHLQSMSHCYCYVNPFSMPRLVNSTDVLEEPALNSKFLWNICKCLLRYMA
jgi:hypothetical protein